MSLPARALLHQVEVPPGLYAIMRCAPLVVRVRASEEARVQLLMEMYSRFESLGTARCTPCVPSPLSDERRVALGRWRAMERALVRLHRLAPTTSAIV